MTLLEDKEKIYYTIIQGEEICITNVATAFSECWVYKACVTISDKVIAIIDIENNHAEYKTLIVSKDKRPIVTKESTTDIMYRYRKKHESNYQFSKVIIKAVFGKNSYLHGYMTKRNMFIPLEGESKGNVTYFNLAYIDGVIAQNQIDSIISFSNDMDISVPRAIGCVKNKQKNYLQNFIAYNYCQAFSIGEQANFDPFKHWEGICYKEYNYLITEVISQIDEEVILECRVKSNMVNDLKEERVIRLFEEYYELN